VHVYFVNRFVNSLYVLSSEVYIEDREDKIEEISIKAA